LIEPLERTDTEDGIAAFLELYVFGAELTGANPFTALRG
jgi:hypothetical protein